MVAPFGEGSAPARVALRLGAALARAASVTVPATTTGTDEDAQRPRAELGALFSVRRFSRAKRVSKALQAASRAGARVVVLVGEHEAALEAGACEGGDGGGGGAQVKCLETGEQMEAVGAAGVVQAVRAVLAAGRRE